MSKDKSSVKYDLEMTPLVKSVLEQLVSGHISPQQSGKRAGKGMHISVDPSVMGEREENPSLIKSIMRSLGKDEVYRHAFESDPSQVNQYSGLYKSKMRLTPDHILKRISIQDDLVASIVNARSAQLSQFGRALENRFEFGFKIEPKKGVLDRCNPKQQEALNDRIEAATERLLNCGKRTGWADEEQLSFSEWLYLSTRYALVCGRIATEVIFNDTLDGRREFHSFRVIDAGTIYKATPQQDAAQQVREQALKLLEQIKNEKLNPEKYVNDQYTWVQVIDGKPMQAFTSKECLVKNFYPCADIELDGYPVTPIDTVLSAITTHLNIVTHNKLYFQSGRAARGMLVIKSTEVDNGLIDGIRQQFNASINSVNNAWRMPVFGINPEDELEWQPIDSGTRDMEFQYLCDMNARVILSAFQMSPEELPGWTYLSRGTNNQALSESNNEYRLEAHRDLGIRPLIKQFEDYINGSILQLIDPTLAKLCVVKLKGLDAETAEKEAVRIGQDGPIHLTQNEIMDQVEKDPIDADLCGDILLSPAWQALLDKYQTVGVIRAKLMGLAGDEHNDDWGYVRDPFWMQWQQLKMQMMQMQQPQGGAPAPGGAPPDGGGDSGGGGEAPPPPADGGDGAPPPDQQDQSAAPQGDGGQELMSGIDQVIQTMGGGEMSKSEKHLPPSKRRILQQHRRLLDEHMKALTEDMEAVTREVAGIADHNLKG